MSIGLIDLLQTTVALRHRLSTCRFRQPDNGGHRINRGGRLVTYSLPFGAFPTP
jgi:hypothetical protein